jgi:Iodothyronine deiodinase
MDYLYPHFKRSFLVEDAKFTAGPRPGEPMPDFDLATLAGPRLRKRDLAGKPFLLGFGSFTCPMTGSAGPALKRLHHELGDAVRFITLYVREAHPGTLFPQPESLKEKVAHARAFRQREGVSWTIAADDLEGTLHRALTPTPNSAYLVDAKGIVQGRILWANDVASLRRGLLALAAGRAPGEMTSRAVAMLRGLGRVDRVLRQSGGYALTDFRRQVPPMYALARLATAFKPLPALGRGIAAVATALGAVALAVLGTRALLRAL